VNCLCGVFADSQLKQESNGRDKKTEKERLS
jgi:hypothetical protein